MSYPDGPGAQRERPDKECAAPTGIGDGASISLEICDPSISRRVLVERDAGPVNPDIIEKPAGSVIPFSSRCRASLHPPLRTDYLNRRVDPRHSQERAAVERNWLACMAEPD